MGFDMRAKLKKIWAPNLNFLVASMDDIQRHEIHKYVSNLTTKDRSSSEEEKG